MNHTRDNRWTRLRWGLHGTGLALVVLAWFIARVFVMSPLAEHSQGIEQRLTKLESRLSQADSIRQEHRRLTNSLDEMARNASLVRERIPDEPRDAEFLGQLEQIARREQVAIQNYRRASQSTNKTHSQLLVTLSIQGNYQGVCGFLDQLAKLPRIAAVEKMELISPTAGSEYLVDLTLSLYFGLKTEETEREGGQRGSS